MDLRYALLTGVLGVCLCTPADTLAQGRSLSHGNASRHVRTAHHPASGGTHLRGDAPPNDDCANAQALTIISLLDCASGAIDGDNGAATTTTEIPECDDSATGVQDVWFTFNSGDNTSVFIDLMPSPDMTDWGMVVTQGCGGDVAFCNFGIGGPQPIEVLANTDYMIQIYSNLDFGVGGPFSLCLSIDDSPVPANDGCHATTPEALAVGGTLHLMGTTAGATADGDFAQTDLGLIPAVWHAFTLSECADVTIDLCGTTPAFTNFYIVISPDCPLDTATAIFSFSDNTTDCGDNNTTLLYLGLQPGTYYIPVLSEIGTAYGPYMMNVSAATCAVAPPNDDCAGAIALTPGPTCSFVEGTAFLATQTLPANECNGVGAGSANDDVWYMVTATGTAMTFAAQGNGDFDGVFELFSGGCDGLVPLDCSDTTFAGGLEVIEEDGLTAGNVYYLRLFHWLSGNPADFTFNVCAVEGLVAGVSEQGSATGITLFPNPTEGDVSITYRGANGMLTLDLIDMTGRTVLSLQRPVNDGGTLALPLGGRLSAGAYSLRASSPGGRTTHRLVVR